MPEHEAQRRAFYDHEAEEARPVGRRRRPVADWGVGEDSFERVPSRRSARAGGTHARPRTHEERLRPRDAGVPSDRDAPGARPDRDAPGARPDRDAPDADAGRGSVAPVRARVSPDQPTLVIEPAQDGSGARAATDGRRTIVIGGRPDPAPRPTRRRPPRTAAERVGASPDRIVAYAFALGLLLILIAILSAGH